MISYHRRGGAAVAAAVAVVTLSTFSACKRAPSGTPTVSTAADRALLPGPMPDSVPTEWVGLIGEYDVSNSERLILENNGTLWLADTSGAATPLVERTPGAFTADRGGTQRLLGTSATEISFTRDAGGRATEVIAGSARLRRRMIEPAPGTNQLRVTPLRPVDALRAEAMAMKPPAETGSFRAPRLVELTKLDSTIHLEIRYATTNNFLGARFYDQPRAFLQRPAAEAVVRANAVLRTLGYGLLIHDAYRPWYVTKMFWDATPADKKWLVADPSAGSRHNRGAAVDLTLFDLATGKAVEMPSTYDESTDRAYAHYRGGTSQQRWRRELLRRAMVAQGFEINPSEWWHFDYKDWKSYAIGNEAFDRLK